MGNGTYGVTCLVIIEEQPPGPPGTTDGGNGASTGIDQYACQTRCANKLRYFSTNDAE